MPVLAALDLFPTAVVVILLWVAAVAVWDPLHFALARPHAGGRTLVVAIARFIWGALFALLAMALTARALPENEWTHYSSYAVAAFLAALLVDALIGDQIRAILRLRK